LNNILSAIPSDLSRDEWLAALPRALVAGFIKTDKDFQEKGIALQAWCHILLGVRSFWMSFKLYFAIRLFH